MRKLWKLAGVTLFWAGWPLLFVYLRLGWRTRILVIHADRILAVRGWLGTDRWALPGGGLHRHESAEDGVLRELAEETGLMLSRNQIESLLETTIVQNGIPVRMKFFAALLDEALPVRRQRGEITEAEWVSMAELDRNNSSEDVLRALQAWRSRLK